MVKVIPLGQRPLTQLVAPPTHPPRDCIEYFLLWGPAILRVGIIPGKREYWPWEPPVALLAATSSLASDRLRAVSRPGQRWTDCPGHSDGRCKDLDEQHGRFNPAGVERPLPEPATGKCLRTLLEHMSRPSGLTVFGPQCLKTR